MRRVDLTVLVSWSLGFRAEAQAPLLPQAKAAFERYAPNSRFHEDAIAFGDLNADGITDFVTCVGDPYFNDDGVENLKVAVFLGAKDNTFSFHAVSSEILGSGGVYHLLNIDRQSKFLHRDGSGGSCSHGSEEFEFKMRNGQLMLIGLETALVPPEGITEPDAGVTANLLTSRGIRWIYVGKHRREKKVAVPGLKPVPLQGFNYEVFSEKWASILW